MLRLARSALRRAADDGDGHAHGDREGPSELITYLDRILDAHRATAAADTRDLGGLVEAALGLPPVRGFRAALAASARQGDVAIIAEVKRRSPSKGDLAPALDAAALAREYADGGAVALSVLTDTAFFGARPGDLADARGAVDLPVLRKDFTVDMRDVVDARLMGADCVLLIVAALEQDELVEMLALCRTVGLDALVEIHDEAELSRAVDAGADLIGVNQRDLVTFAVDTARAVRVAPLMPEGVVRVAESGITGPADAAVLAGAGYHAVLVGEALVTSGDARGAVASLRHARR